MGWKRCPRLKHCKSTPHLKTAALVVIAPHELQDKVVSSGQHMPQRLATTASGPLINWLSGDVHRCGRGRWATRLTEMTLCPDACVALFSYIYNNVNINVHFFVDVIVYAQKLLFPFLFYSIRIEFFFKVIKLKNDFAVICT